MFDGLLSGHFGGEIAAAFEGLGKRDTAAKATLTTENKDDMQLEQRERKIPADDDGTLDDSGAKRCIERGFLGILRLLMNGVGSLSGSFSVTRCIHEIRL
jgi:hypothetical protein